MLTDLLTVMRKEMREILMPEGRFQGGAKNVLILIGIAGLLFPLQTGPKWLSSWTTIYSACFPAILLLNYAADSFAGERERHTLETLLASRLPDEAVLLGKVLSIVLYGWALILVSQVVAVVGLTAVHGHGRLLFFEGRILLALAAIGLALPLVLTTAGILVSMTAPTVRTAGQRMLIPFLALYGLPSLIPFLANKFQWKIDPTAFTPERVVMGIVAAALLVSVALLMVASRRFRREKLVLC